MRSTPSDYTRQQPTCFPCFTTPEVRALAARMAEIAGEMNMDVETHIDDFVDSLQFPGHIYQRLSEFRKIYDRFLYEVVNRSQLNVTCSKGCSACCHVLPCGLEPLEVLEIYNRVKKWEDFDDIMSRSVEAMKAFYKVLGEVNKKEKKQIKNGVDGFSLSLSNYALLRIPCIFLDRNDGLCRVYDIRPFICRSVFSLSDPLMCDPVHDKFSERVLEVIEPVDEINYVLIQMNAAISEALGVRFPDLLQHGLLAWHRWVQEKGGK
jgi:Fe-S-cluster containining protein